MNGTGGIRTPDQRVRVFVSSTLQELAAERQAVRDAVTRLRLVPVMFDVGARSHPPQAVYRAYVAQSQVFVGVYWQSYGWTAPGEQVSGLEDEYLLSAELPKLIYVKSPAPDREPRLVEMLARIRDEGAVSYQHFADVAELQQLIENDLAVLLSERFELARSGAGDTSEAGPTLTLPVPATPLLGRESEAAAVVDLILREGVRLVTLTGPGGVGKTRLMLEVARRTGAELPNGARFVDLASVRMPDLVAAAIAAGLGLNTSADRLITDLESYLQARHLLLALDNFEQVMGAAPLLADLLRASPGLAILVTSRAVLRLSGEHEFAVPPLLVPPVSVTADPAELLKFASVSLFAERAHAAAPAFALAASNAAAVAEICRRLDGLPLAIELAAAQVRLLSPQVLLARLGGDIDLLTGGARDLPERQRTLRNTLDWSFGLLSGVEQVLFARLGVFAGPFSLSAAEAVGADAPGQEQAASSVAVVNGLGALVDSSLVRADTRGSEPQYDLLQTMREYAIERLAASSDWVSAHDRHAAYFQALAEPRSDEFNGPGHLAWLDRLETERDNLLAAVSWLTANGRLESAIHLFLQTWRFWWLHGHLAEFVPFADTMEASAGQLPPLPGALGFLGAAFIAVANGNEARGEQLFERSLALYSNAEGTLAVVMAATAMAALGHLVAVRGDDERAAKLLDNSRDTLRSLRDDDLPTLEHLQYQLTRTFVANFLGQIRIREGDPDAATDLIANGLAVARRTHDSLSMLISVYDLAFSRQAQGDLAGAAELLKEGLALAAGAGDESSAASYLEGLAAVAERQDDLNRSVRLFAASQSLLAASGSGWLHAYVQRFAHGDAVMAALRSRLGDAAFEEARNWGASVGSRRAREYALQ